MSSPEQNPGNRIERSDEPKTPEKNEAPQEKPPEPWRQELAPALQQFLFEEEIERPLDTPGDLPLTEDEKAIYGGLVEAYQNANEKYIEQNRTKDGSKQYYEDAGKKIAVSKEEVPAWTEGETTYLYKYRDIKEGEVGTTDAEGRKIKYKIEQGLFLRGDPGAFSNAEREDLIERRLEIRSFLEQTAKEHGVEFQLPPTIMDLKLENIRQSREFSKKVIQESTEDRALEFARQDVEKASQEESGGDFDPIALVPTRDLNPKEDIGLDQTLFLQEGRALSEAEILREAENTDLRSIPTKLETAAFGEKAASVVAEHNALVEKFYAAKAGVIEEGIARGTLEDFSSWEDVLTPEKRAELLGMLGDIQTSEQKLLDAYRTGETIKPSSLETIRTVIARRKQKGQGSEQPQA